MSYLLLPGWLYSGSILLAPLEQPTFHSCHLLFPAVLPWLFQPKSSPPSTRLSWLVPLLLVPGLHSLLSSPLLLQSFLRALTSLHGLRCHSRRRRTGLHLWSCLTFSIPSNHHPWRLQSRPPFPHAKPLSFLCLQPWHHQATREPTRKTRAHLPLLPSAPVSLLLSEFCKIVFSSVSVLMPVPSSRSSSH